MNSTPTWIQGFATFLGLLAEVRLRFYANICRFVMDIAVLLLAVLLRRRLESRRHAQHV